MLLAADLNQPNAMTKMFEEGVLRIENHLLEEPQAVQEWLQPKDRTPPPKVVMVRSSDQYDVGVIFLLSRDWKRQLI